MYRYLVLVLILAPPSLAFGDSASRGPNGVNATGLLLPNDQALNGADVEIGQVEPGRPAKMPPDSDFNVNPNVVPFQVTNQAGSVPVADTNIDLLTDGHATGVASVIISTDSIDSSVPGNGLVPSGIAPAAKLYSSAYITPGIDPGYPDALRTTQYLAKLFPFSNANHIRAINHSWLKDDTGLGALDGNSLLTLGMDWIAMRHEVLNIVAGPEGSGGTSVPSDNYNGITVAYSGKNGQYWREAGNLNDSSIDALGQRVSIDLLAPGEDVEVGALGGTETIQGGTSVAAPHVTAAVALLNQYADFQIGVPAPRWNSDSPRKHEVMKAVLLNSADRKAGAQGSQRDVISSDDSGNYTWESSFAFTDDEITLDDEMGAGHLNTGRAFTQFETGEYNNGIAVPAIGWDYHETGGTGTQLNYPFETAQSGWISVTLAWDRQITKNGGTSDTYDATNNFTGEDLNDLNVYLVPVGWDNLTDDAVAKSISDYDNVELIFAEVPSGMYEIIVDHAGGLGNDQDYGLAWWFGNAPPADIPGDFDSNGQVDGEDLSTWKNGFGTTYDGEDFLAWQRNYGFGVPATSTSAAVPEPSSMLLCVAALFAFARCRHLLPISAPLRL